MYKRLEQYPVEKLVESIFNECFASLDFRTWRTLDHNVWNRYDRLPNVAGIQISRAIKSNNDYEN